MEINNTEIFWTQRQQVKHTVPPGTQNKQKTYDGLQLL